MVNEALDVMDRQLQQLSSLIDGLVEARTAFAKDILILRRKSSTSAHGRRGGGWGVSLNA